MSLSIKEIVLKYLKENNFDGLFHSDMDCACDIEDLIPCDEPSVACTAGIKVPCDCEEKHDYHIIRRES